MIHMKYFHKKKNQTKINKQAKKNNADQMETRARSSSKVNTRISHEKIKNIKCFGCRETSHTEPETSHIESAHQMLKSNKCSLCVKSFCSKGNLNRHIDMVHNNLKKHVCQICNKGFSTKQVLTNHTNRYH